MPDLSLTLQLHDLLILAAGLVMGHVLFRRGQGQPIMPKILKDKPVPEEATIDNDLIRCQYSEEEEKMIREGRIPTRRG